MEDFNFGKLPGKTEFSGRRRTTTRKSGFSSHPDSTGGEFSKDLVPTYLVDSSNPLRITYKITEVAAGEFIAYGLWFNAEDSVAVTISGGPEKKVQTPSNRPNWGKIGSMWVADNADDVQVMVEFTSSKPTYVAIYEPACGIVKHRHLEWAKSEKPVLLSNMYAFSPEANFITTPGEVGIEASEKEGEPVEIVLKSCNRCARYLPINTSNERYHLSFSNHCVANRPCVHGGFGRLKNKDDSDDVLTLEYGFQLECRFCKKYEVNAAHNPQRTAAQMKEDGTRRRSIELLLTELYGESAQMRFRHKNGGLELTDYIWDKFDGKCFNCEQPLASKNKMNLDHTRPLALLWNLDETATALCADCNNLKRDRPPSDFYPVDKMEQLSEIAGIPIAELNDPTPNMEAIDLIANRLEWFFNEFLRKPELTKVRDGKVPAELLVKALQKTINKLPSNVTVDINLVQEYKRRYH